MRPPPHPLVGVLLPLLPRRDPARSPRASRGQGFLMPAWRCLLCPEDGWSTNRTQARRDSLQHYLDHHYQRPDPPEEEPWPRPDR